MVFSVYRGLCTCACSSAFLVHRQRKRSHCLKWSGGDDLPTSEPRQSPSQLAVHLLLRQNKDPNWASASSSLPHAAGDIGHLSGLRSARTVVPPLSHSAASALQNSGSLREVDGQKSMQVELERYWEPPEGGRLRREMAQVAPAPPEKRRPWQEEFGSAVCFLSTLTCSVLSSCLPLLSDDRRQRGMEIIVRWFVLLRENVIYFDKLFLISKLYLFCLFIQLLKLKIDWS